jgi:hypothetical protein
MKVRELIERLTPLDQEAKVKLTNRDLKRLFGLLEAERIRKEAVRRALQPGQVPIIH